MIKQKKGMALVGVLLVMLFLGVLMMMAFFSASAYTTSSIVQESSDSALYCAQAGVEETLRQLRNGAGLNWLGTVDAGGNPIFQDVNNPANPAVPAGQFSIAQVILPGGLIPDGVWFNIPFRITGWAPSLDGQIATRTLEVVVRAMDPATNIFTANAPLTAGAGATIGGNVFAESFAFATATAANPITITGDLNYIRNLSRANQADVDVQGDINQVANIVFPSINMNNFASAAPGFNFAGNTSLEGWTFDGSTIPGGIIYVDGDLHISGHVANQSIAIAATGDIYITGDITTDNNDVQLGLFSDKNVFIASSVSGDLNVDAFIMAKDGFEAEYDATNPKDTLNFNGAVCVFGNQVGSTSAIDTSAFTQRNFAYNPQLAANNNIPQMFFFADLIELAVAGEPVSQ
ncbi:MAG: hypothetical protein PHY73_08250 [Candidatus Omnitrophica bacterium]|nr:hypothetical protein [Candidatus Omnitrophota bacterium]